MPSSFFLSLITEWRSEPLSQGLPLLSSWSILCRQNHLDIFPPSFNFMCTLFVHWPHVYWVSVMCQTPCQLNAKNKMGHKGNEVLVFKEPKLNDENSQSAIRGETRGAISSSFILLSIQLDTVGWLCKRDAEVVMPGICDLACFFFVTTFADIIQTSLEESSVPNSVTSMVHRQTLREDVSVKMEAGTGVTPL